MRMVGYPKAFYHVARLRIHRPSTKVRERLRCLRVWEMLKARGAQVSEVVKAVDVPRATLYRWRAQLKKWGTRGLEPKSRRPKRVRRPARSPELERAILELRERYPRWGKEKLVILLARQEIRTSASTVGRVLVSLKRRQLLVEPLPGAGWGHYGHKRKRARHRYAVRKPRDYPVCQPGDLVQIDTLEVRPLPNLILKHFGARDVVSRWDVLEVHERATSHTAAQFLDRVIERMPFPVKGIQVDGGSEFRNAFEQACQKRGLRLFVLPPHSPKINGWVERSHRTHKEEFYEIYLDDLRLDKLNHALRSWEQVYNTIRPHHSLDGLTPQEYIQRKHPRVTPISSQKS